jgi:hypothetical protein
MILEMFIIDNSFYKIKETPDRGRGVFAKKEMAPGMVLGDYLGKLIGCDEEEVYDKKYGLYTMNFSQKLTIFPDDPAKEGVHLLNHSCTPNCEAIPYQGHKIFFTLRKIFPGEELTIDYGVAQPDIGDEFSCPCYCGSLLCRGTMHVSRERYQAWEKAVGSDNEKYVNDPGYKKGDLLKPLKSYPKAIEDHPIYNLWANHVQSPLALDNDFLPSISGIRQQLRASGRRLNFKKLNMSVYGVINGLVISGPAKV